MRKLAGYIKKNYQKPENSLMKIVMTYIIIYTVFTIIKIFLDSSSYDTLLQHLSLSGRLVDNYKQPWRLLLYTCLVPGQYGGILYFIFCLYWLHSFGHRLVRLLNNTHLVRLYVLSSLFCAFFFLLTTHYLGPLLLQDIETFSLVGPFGPICAIIVAVATISPDYPYHILFFRVKLKYFSYILLVFFLLQLSHQETPPKEFSCYLASIGALLFGYLYVQYQQSSLSTKVVDSWDWLKGLFVGNNSIKKERKASKRTGKDDIESILDKISTQGYRSLTHEEKKKLFEA